MSDIEGKILRIYDKSKPEDEDLYETSNVNHVAWGLVVVLAGLVGGGAAGRWNCGWGRGAICGEGR